MDSSHRDSGRNSTIRPQLPQRTSSQVRIRPREDSAHLVAEFSRRGSSDGVAAMGSRPGHAPFLSSQYPSQWPSQQPQYRPSRLPPTAPALQPAAPPSIPQRKHSSGAVSDKGETWKDFLKSTTETTERMRPKPEMGASSNVSEQESEISTVIGRKRRPSSPNDFAKSRSSAGPGSGLNVYGMGASASNPIDLTSPRPPLPTSRSGSYDHQRRTCGNITLPRWQPDAEVSSCPVCGVQFNMWYRRHHCRKCGRVVCAGCSPHRITIPRQFIVQPPATTYSSFSSLGGSPEISQNSVDVGAMQGSSITRFTSKMTSDGMASGGEVVRVCNPCVPDPNFSPPPQQGALAAGQGFSPMFLDSQHFHTDLRGRHSTVMGPPAVPVRISSASNHDAASKNAARQLQSTSRHSQSSLEREPDKSNQQRTGPRAAYEAFMSHTRALHNHGFRAVQPSLPALSSTAISRQPASLGQAAAFHHYRDRTSSNIAIVPPRNIPGHRRTTDFDPNALLPPPPCVSSSQQAHRQINEEDECPICHAELPPKGSDGDETSRMQHVQDCINLHSLASASSSTPQTTSGHASIPGVRTAGGASASTASSLVSGSPVQHRKHAMLVYDATEKDCISQRGEQQECVICLEDIEVGQEMARLECLCRFHKRCIRSWWDTKGNGECPTHQITL